LETRLQIPFGSKEGILPLTIFALLVSSVVVEGELQSDIMIQNLNHRRKGASLIRRYYLHQVFLLGL
jgi:hypothetical protein